ncbi:MAG TPA: hypothetical protein VKR53_01690 [Puia sp.]|nr:hypothetical protein [Puia sp.]
MNKSPSSSIRIRKEDWNKDKKSFNESPLLGSATRIFASIFCNIICHPCVARYMKDCLDRQLAGDRSAKSRIITGFVLAPLCLWGELQKAKKLYRSRNIIIVSADLIAQQ